MEFLDDYSEEDAKSIMATLNVVQSRGWSAQTDDQYQFHIILGSAIRCYESKIEQLENNLEKTVDESHQNFKDFKDMKDELRQEREINEELVVQGIHTLWKDDADEMPSRRKARTYQLVPTGWKEWWVRMDTEADAESTRSRLSKSKIKQMEFKERTLPNILLTGWRGWWARMEAEGLQAEGHGQQQQEDH